MDFGIAGTVALVTGASRGIGRAVAEGLAREGAKVMMSARRPGPLEEAAAALRSDGLEVASHPADVTSPEAIDRLLTAVRTRYGDPDILVVNAGGPPSGLPSDVSEEDWQRGFSLTLMSAVRLGRTVLPAMRARRWGRIVNITSLSVREPIPSLTLSNAYRAAVTGYARTLATEVAVDGVTVNNVAPGYTATESLEEVVDTAEAKQRLVQRIPARRLAEPAEIAAMVAFLASRQAAYVTGQTLLVDGGAVGSPF